MTTPTAQSHTPAQPHTLVQPELPSTMRACILQRQGDMTLETLSLPELDPDQVLVQVAAVGVCGSDVHYYEHGRIGDYVVDHPLILGHELSGRIAAVGSAVDPARVGNRVAVEPQRPCRKCKQCKAGRYNLCPDIEFYATPPIDGAFAEYVTIQADFAYDIPDNVSDEAAALIEPLSVGLWACERADIKPGSRVLIAGAGPIGIIAAQAARAFGATDIYITDIAEDRLAFALEHGATHALNAKTDSVEGLDVDAFIDASGAPQAVRSGIKAVGPAGRVILVGLGADDVELPVSYIQNREIWLSGVFRYTNTWPLAIQLIADGKVDLDVLVTGRFALAEAEEALKAGKQPGQLKAVVYPGR
ncbi:MULTISPECIES: NAD(P)-dependent alcohol dehydrogenase [Arthrobacter]|uniref:NAD(P)-dependent alcohol dehydrogenase n=1 Tax=Arthrobacter terricola TaxID=2547396 RepID=A0A4R5K9I8_9MICC|nr:MULTISPECIES: NAD(P)-dependent alcohol dehydrogenase [Arthrobacter]MBT8163475.1 NAD(P)-dependent alcohol dehydrogenase [Arthrobacter sp. GN70]TDF89751.1 NAD(P)-dependent alcohol dehydrogenase [Arthrobacter terricola]